MVNRVGTNGQRSNGQRNTNVGNRANSSRLASSQPSASRSTRGSSSQTPNSPARASFEKSDAGSKGKFSKKDGNTLPAKGSDRGENRSRNHGDNFRVFLRRNSLPCLSFTLAALLSSAVGVDGQVSGLQFVSDEVAGNSSKTGVMYMGEREGSEFSPGYKYGNGFMGEDFQNVLSSTINNAINSNTESNLIIYSF